MTLRTAIEALADRHQDNHISVEFGDQVIEVEGKMTSAPEAFLRQAQEAYVSGLEAICDSAGCTGA